MGNLSPRAGSINLSHNPTYVIGPVFANTSVVELFAYLRPLQPDVLVGIGPICFGDVTTTPTVVDGNQELLDSVHYRGIPLLFQVVINRPPFRFRLVNNYPAIA